MKTVNKVKKVKVGSKGPEMTRVQIQVSKDPENRPGLRGLRGLVFAKFESAWKAKKPLPTMDELGPVIEANFPQSRWLARPKIHYSYYKSKFLQSVKA